MKRKWDWALTRKNWTRKEQKTRIQELMKLAYRKGDFSGLTAKTIAIRLEQLSADYIRDICNEMVSEKLLTYAEVVHRQGKNGFSITKRVYYLADIGRWKEMYADQEAERGWQKTLW